MIRTILIDDEAINIDMLQNRLAKYCPHVEVVETAVSVQEGLEKIILHKPDLIFLDIEIHDQTGFDLLNALQDETLNVILCTAYDKYALEGYKYNILGYLLKPIDIVELVNFVKKAERNIAQKNVTISTQFKNNFITIHNRTEIEFIRHDEIIYLFAQSAYTQIVTNANKKYVSSKSIGDFEYLTEDKKFCRVHNSYILNIEHVTKVIKSKYGIIVISNGDEIPIAASRKKEVVEWLGL